MAVVRRHYLGLLGGMFTTRPEVDKAEVNSHEAEAEAKIVLKFSAKFYFLTPFSPKKTKFSVDFRRHFKNFG